MNQIKNLKIMENQSESVKKNYIEKPVQQNIQFLQKNP